VPKSEWGAEVPLRRKAMAKPPVPSEKALAKLDRKLLDLKYRVGTPVQDITVDWSVQTIREMLNVTNSDPTGRLAAQIKQSLLQERPL
jgi:hypothetical protein